MIETRPEHLNSLVRKLREPEVRRVLETVLAVTNEPDDFTYSDDRSYALDLGLVATGPDGTLRIANPIYAEVIARSHPDRPGQPGPRLPKARDFVRPDGRFDVPGMLVELSRFWRNQPMIKRP